jgi:hypothetical protein
VPIVAREMVLCRYNGMNEPSYGSLRTTRIITDVAVVERWRKRFTLLPSPSSGPRRCPLDDDRRLRIAFIASERSYVVLSADLAGCGGVTNGLEVRVPGGTADLRFRYDLVRLAGG